MRYLPGLSLTDVRTMTMRELQRWVSAAGRIVRAENEGNGEEDA